MSMAPSDHGDDDAGLSDFTDTPSKNSVEDLTVDEQEEEVVVVVEDKSADDGAKEKNNTGADEANDEASDTAVDIPLQFIGENTPGGRRKRGKIVNDPNSVWTDVKRLRGVPKERDELFKFTHVCRALLPNGEPCNHVMTLTRQRGAGGVPGTGCWVNNKAIRHMKEHHPEAASTVAQTKRDDDAHETKMELMVQQPTL